MFLNSNQQRSSKKGIIQVQMLTLKCCILSYLHYLLPPKSILI
uniref:Uncharacterized protein n=1 Tax=Rhizophora mucronata TaxID=61149 RepID=A0A2P2QDK7_RHIMU